MAATTGSFSLEAVVLGRNDEYEPGWAAKLRASVAYNHALLAAHGIDYRVAFVEWNPPADRELLAPALVREFPFLRGIVIDAGVHTALCTSSDLQMMLNFAYNPALRTSRADYCLITSGDLFFGRALARRIRAGLKPGCLYRAERVNIREDIDVLTASADDIEDPANVVSIDTCSEPPYDRPPYSHASGDFLLLDRLTMAGLRGFDESIRFARLHLDSRFCFTAMHAGLDCELLGQIFHINHRNAYTNRLNDYPGRSYDYDAGLPYVNSPRWGLADLAWRQLAPRLCRIDLGPGADDDLTNGLGEHETDAADAVTTRLLEIRAGIAPAAPRPGVPVDSVPLPLDQVSSSEVWKGASVTSADDTIVVQTPTVPWAYAAWLPLQDDRPHMDGDWSWIRVRATVRSGAIGIGLLRESALSHERFLSATNEEAELWLQLPRDSGIALLIRNGDTQDASTVVIRDIALIRQSREGPRLDEFLIGSHSESAARP